MSFGFRIYNADGTVQIDSDSIGLLFIDDFNLGANASVTKTYAGLAPVTLTVVSIGTTTVDSGAVVTQTTSGSDRQVTVTTRRPGRYSVMVE